MRNIKEVIMEAIYDPLVGKTGDDLATKIWTHLNDNGYKIVRMNKQKELKSYLDE